MVSVNVAQLLQSAPGTVREIDFSEALPDPSPEVHLLGPVAGHARLTLTSRGVLVQASHHELVALECARCLDEVRTELRGSFEEEFLPTQDVRSGLPVAVDPEDVRAELPRIDAHHEIVLDETLRQTILTDVPLRVLCDTACPGLCAECGQRLGAQHRPHPTPKAPPDPDPTSPFAGLARLLADDTPESR
jgi:uncharacterized protein